MFGQNLDIYDNFAKMQTRILAKIFVEDKSASQTENSKEIVEFFNAILSYGSDVCEITFGDFGSRLYEIANDIDFEHPEVKYGQFLASLKTDDASRRKLLQLLKLCALSKDNDLDDIYPLLSKCVAKAVLPEIKTSLDFLKNQQQFIRLFHDPENRHQFRTMKTIRPIELSSSLKKTIGIWDTVSDLETYVRGGNCYKDQIEIINKKAEIYKTMRLESMYNDLKTSIHDFELAFEDQYYSFQRVPMTIASIILAKMHNCTIDPVSGTRLVFPAKNFQGYDFENTEYDYGFLSNGVGLPKTVSDFDYMPMVYPTYCLEPSAQMKEVIDCLEHFPEASGKPIFDHYLVVVPSVHFPRKPATAGQFVLIDSVGKKKYFTDSFSARVELDTILIREKFIVPTLLGEKDGKCYFICFWM